MKIFRCWIMFFSLKISSFGLLSTFEKAFLLHEGEGGGVRSANFWGWGHECQLFASRVSTFCITQVNFLHHESQLFASRESTFCISRVNFLHLEWQLFASRVATSQLKEPRVLGVSLSLLSNNITLHSLFCS